LKLRIRIDSLLQSFKAESHSRLAIPHEQFSISDNMMVPGFSGDRRHAANFPVLARISSQQDDFSFVGHDDQLADSRAAIAEGGVQAY
jgi:hypothetical protein